MPDTDHPHEQNRKSWNAVTSAHNAHKQDQATFLRAGNSTLFPEETELLGDIRGKRLVHLQCNCGQDTLSIAGLGADVTGVDISDEAVSFATRLSEDSGIPAKFHREDVLTWLATTEERFDAAFASYGVVGWLSDIDAWAQGIARILRPGQDGARTGEGRDSRDSAESVSEVRPGVGDCVERQDPHRASVDVSIADPRSTDGELGVSVPVQVAE